MAVGQEAERSYLNHTHRKPRANRKWVKVIDSQSLIPVTYFSSKPALPIGPITSSDSTKSWAPSVQCEPIRDSSHSNNHKGLKRNFNKQEIQITLTST